MTDTTDALNAAIQSMADSMRAQTEAFTKAMDAQTEEIKRLSSKVDTMQTRVIRLEEQRHGKDIEKLSSELGAAMHRLTALEMNWATARGAGVMMTTLKNFTPWIISLIVGFLLVSGIDVASVLKGKTP